MKIDKRIAFLGAGNMAGALIEGLLASGSANADQITATDLASERLATLEKSLGIRTTLDNAAATRGADAIVLAVKPQALGALLSVVGPALPPSALVISIAAGVPLAAIEEKFAEGTRMVRAMPNAPALVHAGATGIAAGRHATGDDMELVRALFESVGLVLELGEPHLDAVTGLSGSGPAYVFLFIEALSDAGVAAGLDPETARALSAQTVLGAAKLLLETGESPRRLKDRVTSPGGTTLAGLGALEAGGFSSTVASAVAAATVRAGELGREASEKLGSGDG